MAAALFRHLFGRSAYVGSAGVRKGELDPFAVAAMEEIGLDIAKHRPATFEEIEDYEGSTSTHRHPGAGGPPQGARLTRTLALDVEYWPTADPTIAEGTASSGSTPTATSATS